MFHLEGSELQLEYLQENPRQINLFNMNFVMCFKRKWIKAKIVFISPKLQIIL